MKNKITIPNLLKNGFKMTTKNEKDGIYVLDKKVKNWNLSYTEDKKHPLNCGFNIEADGGYDTSGEFDISHFKTIAQIDNLINAMNGNIT